VEEDIRVPLAELIGCPHRTRTLISEEGWKYTRHSNGESMLFDLEADPNEMQELGHTDHALRGRADSHMVDALMDAADDARGAPVT
ncbi:MAG: hypothetical protein GY773_29760, partial [Actinomycetia bacterium]|nr:hypothetical protein [Actinomycetes bacterium]